MENEYTIHAMKVDSGDRKEIYDSLINDGESRFGWSYKPELNHIKIKESLEKGEALSDLQRNNYFWWLIDDIKIGDYLVYINVPVYEDCTIVKVTRPYYWKDPMADDYNHCFGIDKNRVYTFNRNSSIVNDYFAARLKLQGKHWRIKGCNEYFENLLEELKKGNSGERRTIEDNVKNFNKEIDNSLNNISEVLNRNFPNKSLEVLLQKVFENIPNVVSVENKKGSGDCGADLIVKYDKQLPFLMNRIETWYVQVKSYTENCSYTNALDGLIKAMETYNDDTITEAIIAITSTNISDDVLKNIEKYNNDEDNENKVKVTILYGAKLARFVLKYLSLMDYND